MKKRELRAEIASLREEIGLLRLRIEGLEMSPLAVPYNPWAPIETPPYTQPWRITWGTGTADPFPEQPGSVCATTTSSEASPSSEDMLSSICQRFSGALHALADA